MLRGRNRKPDARPNGTASLEPPPFGLVHLGEETDPAGLIEYLPEDSMLAAQAFCLGYRRRPIDCIRSRQCCSAA